MSGANSEKPVKSKTAAERRHRVNVETVASQQLAAAQKARATGQPVPEYVPLWQR